MKATALTAATPLIVVPADSHLEWHFSTAANLCEGNGLRGEDGVLGLSMDELSRPKLAATVGMNDRRVRCAQRPGGHCQRGLHSRVDRVVHDPVGVDGL
jgi:hypothetical protein